MVRFFIAACLVCAVACGDDGDDGVDSGVDVCGFGSSRYLPYEVGFSWELRVSDPISGTVTTKTQRIDSSLTHTDGMPAFLQITQKTSGRTENITRIVQDAVVRLDQKDYNGLGDLLRTTVYDPPKIRLDEASGRIAAAAEWDEVTTEIEYDPLGVEVARVEVTEHWTVLGVDVPCSSPLGTFTCLNLRRTRVGGGVADKEFMFARGIGKIREDGGQIEQLLSCSAN